MRTHLILGAVMLALSASPALAAPAAGAGELPAIAAATADLPDRDGLADQLREAATRIDSDTPLSQRTAFDLVVPVVQGAAVIATLRDWTDSFRDTSMAFFMVMLIGLVAGATRRPCR